MDPRKGKNMETPTHQLSGNYNGLNQPLKNSQNQFFEPVLTAI
jgi:hypothetical protein